MNQHGTDTDIIRQHLERMHTIPVHCPKCYAVFRNNTEARDKHVREGTCQTVPERCLEGIDKATMRKLKRRGTSKSVQDSWYSLFALLFPGAKKPESPCKHKLRPDNTQHLTDIYQSWILRCPPSFRPSETSARMKDMI